jgi:hypothetical protein
MHHLFDFFICAEDVTEHKPSPVPYLEAAKKLGIPPSRCRSAQSPPFCFFSATLERCLSPKSVSKSSSECLAGSTIQEHEGMQFVWEIVRHPFSSEKYSEFCKLTGCLRMRTRELQPASQQGCRQSMSETWPGIQNRWTSCVWRARDGCLGNEKVQHLPRLKGRIFDPDRQTVGQPAMSRVEADRSPFQL